MITLAEHHAVASLLRRRLTTELNAARQERDVLRSELRTLQSQTAAAEEAQGQRGSSSSAAAASSSSAAASSSRASEQPTGRREPEGQQGKLEFAQERLEQSVDKMQ